MNNANKTETPIATATVTRTAATKRGARARKLRLNREPSAQPSNNCAPLSNTRGIAEVLTPAFLQAFQLSNAQECVRCWLEQEPERVEAWRYHAKVCAHLQNGEEALRSYRRAVDLDPEDDELRLQLAGELIQAHQPQPPRCPPSRPPPSPTPHNTPADW